MNAQTALDSTNSADILEGSFEYGLEARHRSGMVWRSIFMFSTVVGVIALTALLLNIINQTFGYAAVTNKIDPAELAVNGVPLELLDRDQLVAVLQDNVSAGLFRKLENDLPMEQRTSEDLLAIIMVEVVEPSIEKTWSLWDSLVNFSAIRAEVKERFPQSYVRFFSWLNPDFLVTPQSSDPLQAGVRTAILGSLWTIAITILFSFPIGVGAAIYLEEYARDNWINRVIQTNINNLAGVPSIIYGILGLAIFVRVLEPITSGVAFGLVEDPTTANGRTILSAGLTLGLLILPLIIINAQEAIKAVPSSLRQASFGLGATKWQTTWSHVLPNAIPGILTGTILAISRAIGETAPLVVVGASTFITRDPQGPFSK
ncbi:MAG: phosphate ABC transporter permease PstA, partial [Anaerolineales bacterium]